MYSQATQRLSAQPNNECRDRTVKQVTNSSAQTFTVSLFISFLGLYKKKSSQYFLHHRQNL